ncbi:NAD(P)-binding protein [Trichoderma citrinoviride]|uniref:NAD(P)-binding protein n=1 Tax=Trichoderma citrinoviride TaxID=58853 RepID=A0A2T4B8L4_9HYPO|nr:NAD(P)-binding protein [Trichoderma citrinoviride]PTB65559.1 NAD(P)-binding protein [Trichoderma citrinoviride]
MADSLSLTNKVAIITGSGRENGIGAAIALTLAKAGARVVINYVSDATSPRAETVRSRIEAAAGKNSVIVVKADVSTTEGCKMIVGEALNKFKVDHIDIIVNNAAAAIIGPALRTSAEDMTRAFQVSVIGPVLLLQEACPHMPKYSRIINIGTVASRLGLSALPIYAAAKAAMDQLTWSLAREIGRDGKHITINTIAPGPVKTDNLPDTPQAAALADWLVSLTRNEERIGTAEDIADAVLLLTSEKSRWITGQFISVSGEINGG